MSTLIFQLYYDFGFVEAHARVSEMAHTILPYGLYFDGNLMMKVYTKRKIWKIQPPTHKSK